MNIYEFSFIYLDEAGMPEEGLVMFESHFDLPAAVEEFIEYATNNKIEWQELVRAEKIGVAMNVNTKTTEGKDG